MNKLGRFLLLVVLAVSLPFHTAYGLTMSQCKALEHESRQTVSADTHGHHGSADSHDHAKHADGTTASTEDGPVAGSHCGACSACGTSIAITGPMLPPISAGDYTAPHPLPEQRLDSIAPSRLDRPPLAA